MIVADILVEEFYVGTTGPYGDDPSDLILVPYWHHPPDYDHEVLDDGVTLDDVSWVLASDEDGGFEPLLHGVPGCTTGAGDAEPPLPGCVPERGVPA
jgi:hypothetical protein